MYDPIQRRQGGGCRRLNARFLVAAPILLLVCSILSGCGGGARIELSPEFREAVLAGASRDADRIMPYLSSEDADARSYAWRSLAFTAPTDPSALIELAAASGSPEAWHSLARIPLDDSLRDGWLLGARASLQSSGGETVTDGATDAICQFLAVQGTIDDARWLMDRFAAEELDRHPRCALAVGMLAAGAAASPEDLLRIATLAGTVRTTDAAKGLIYAFSRVARHRPDPGSALQSVLEEAWTGRHGVGVDPELDAWMIRSLGPVSIRILWTHLQEPGIASESVRAMEMARTMRDMPLDSLSDSDLLVLSVLLDHPDPNVSVMMADGLAGRRLPASIIALLEERYRRSLNPELRMSLAQMLAASMDADSRRGWLKQELPGLSRLLARNPYLSGRMMLLWSSIESRGETLLRIEHWLREGGILATQAITGLPSLIGEDLMDGEQAGDPRLRDDIDRIRMLVRRAVEQGERGPAFQTEPLLMDDRLFPSSEEFNAWLSGQILSVYRLPEDIEVYQMAERVLSARGGADPIQEAMHHHDVMMAVQGEEGFKAPDWERLERLGAHPRLVLNTERGRIVVRLETLTAPFTVSAIDALVSQGAYHGVPFHRVVPNFVIQGGDVESADGFGGPGFTIPTEISVRSFHRGRLGIASAGPDTEGSQYFLMHAWAPHLDGRYSSLGEVVEGIEIVDAIQIGDRVIRADMESQP